MSADINNVILAFLNGVAILFVPEIRPISFDPFYNRSFNGHDGSFCS
jgi:hypothetical protein